MHVGVYAQSSLGQSVPVSSFVVYDYETTLTSPECWSADKKRTITVTGGSSLLSSTACSH